MADNITLEDIQRKQQELTEASNELIEEKNANIILKRSKEISAMGKDLEEMAKAFENQELAKAPPQIKGYVEVQLTPGQRERIQEDTGVDMNIVRINSEGPFMSQFMPNAAPEYIETVARRQAEERMALEKALTEGRVEAKKLVESLEKAKNPDLRKALKQALDDPTFLNGLLNDD